MEEILKYFTDLSDTQKEQFAAMKGVYDHWNSMINVISRKDMESFYLHHALHSLAIAKVMNFPKGSTILDVGTGGGFPGIPLAVLFPDCHFTLCDSIGKKIKVAQAASDELGLKNVECVNARVEQLNRKFDFVVSRAVTDLASFYSWIKSSYNNAALYLKGGDIDAEIADCARKCKLNPALLCQLPISSIYSEEYFIEKKIVIITK